MGGSLADFMARVVPWPLPGETGVINMHWTHPTHPGMGGKPFGQLSDFLAMVPWCNSHAAFVKDVYFCLSRQRMVGPMRNGRASALRNAGNASHLKAIWCDIDANKLPPKGYASKDDAIAAIIKFVADAGMPPISALVDSGNGYHVYWISKKPLTVEEWRPYAEGLWALMQKHGLHGDPLTTDSVRVLRIPETFNNKTAPAKPVVLKLLGPMYDFDVDLKFVAETAPVQRVALPSGNGNRAGVMLDPSLFPQKTAITDDILAEDCQPKTLPPLDATTVVFNCPHYLDAVKTGGAAHNQGLWMQTILGATWFAKGRKMAHALGWKHPGYDKVSTDAMFDRKLLDREDRGVGWPSCKAFENNGSTACATCPHRGKIKSPLNLGSPATQAAVPGVPANFNVPPPPAGAVDLLLPDGYMINAKGYLVAVKESPVEDDKKAPSKEIQLLKCHIMGPPWAEKGKNGHVLRFQVSADKGCVSDISVRLEDTHTTTALCLCLSQQGCKIAPRGKEHLSDFMVSWLEILHNADEAHYSVPLGWWTDKNNPRAGFAYGGKTIKADGTIGRAGSLGTIAKLYTPTGDIDPWFAAMKLITDQHRPALEALVASCFASPLMVFTGQYAGSVCGQSTDSGTNKSTAIKVGLAVWGHPRLTKQVSGSTHKSILKTLGDIRNLPSVHDDISDPEIMDKLVLTVQSSSQGVGEATLYQNRKQQPREEWDSLLIVTSNRSMFDTMVNKVRDTKAAVNRLFEFVVPDVMREIDGVTEVPGQPGRLPAGEAELIVQKLEDNYGRMGERYAAILGSDPAGVAQVVKAYNDWFRVKCSSTGEERFWLAICATTMAGAHLANMIGASFNLEELKKFLVETYFSMRDRVANAFLSGGSYDNTTSALVAFLIEYSNKSLRTEDMPHPKPGNPKKLMELSGPRDFNQSEVRVHWCVNDRLVRISKDKFTEFLNKTKRSPSSVMAGLIQHYGMVRPMPRFDLTAGTTYQAGPEILIVLPIPVGHWLENPLFARTPLAQIAATLPGQSAAPLGLAPTGAAPPAPSPGP